MIIKRLFSTAMFVLTLNAAASSLHDLKIEGIPSDQIETVKTLSGFLPGDEIDSQRVNRGADRIREYFDGKGYPKVKVTPEVSAKSDKATIRYLVELGEPIQILGFQFKSKTGALPTDLTARLNQVVELKPGETLDRDRVKEIKRTIENTMTAMNYVDSRVVEVTTDELEKGVNVNFIIELGEQVVFSVYGNIYFTRSELMSIIEEQTALGLGRDFVNVIRTRLRDRYVDYGFKRVQVTPYIFEAKGNTPRKVAYEIEEGQKLTLHRVIFDGNEEFSDETLESLYFNMATERIQARIYNEKMAEDAANAMIEDLKRKGYLSAKLIAIKSEESADGKTIDVRLFMSEGLQTKIQSIEFQGNRVLGSEVLLPILGLKEGDPLNLVQLEDGIDRMKREYRNHGYLDIKLVNENGGELVTYSEKNQFAYLSFRFEEGPELRLSNVRIYGNETTRAEVIERELQIQSGEPLAEYKIVQTEERLRRLGVFSQIKLDLTADTGSELTRNMKISVVEAIPGNASIGFGFRNDLGLRLFGEVSYANLWGMNHTWALSLSANRRLGAFLGGNNRISDFRFVEFAARLSYIWPWIFWGETTFRPSLSAESRQYLIFDADTYALNLSFDRMLIRPIKLSGGLTYTLERIRQFNATNARDNQQLRIGSITPTLRLDMRDNPLAPRRGFFALTSFEYANSFLGTQEDPVPVSYGRFQVRTDYYIDVIPRVIWYTSIRGGWLKNFANPYDANGNLNPAISVPLIKQFTLGGVNSLRGYLEQELFIQSDDPNRVIQGYSTYVNYRMQMDFLASQNLSFGPFLDAGNLQVDAFSFGNLKYGTGVGLRYLTPVGPVNFDYGFKLFPQNGQDSNVFYFSIGVI